MIKNKKNIIFLANFTENKNILPRQRENKNSEYVQRMFKFK
jgi:hypothetical protein